MKIILLKDIPKIGKKYDIKDLSDGYVRNFLLPKKLAEEATPNRIAKIEGMRAEQEKEIRAKIESFKRQAKQMTGFKLEFVLKTDGKSVFGAINGKDIKEKLKEKGISINEDQIKMEKHLKEMGEHIVKIKFSPEVEAELKIVLKSE
jgi:large subunit ribosomal protein L9